MQAITISRFGGPEVLELVETPEPEIGPKEVLLELEAAGINFIDTYQRSGLYRVQLPVVLGLEGAGIVSAVGSEVRSFRPGDRAAFCSVQGAYAERIAVPEERLVRVPDEVGLEAAAGLMLQGLTAHYLARSTYELRPGIRCLIHAGAGGVGLLLIQIAKLHGAEVITTVSTEEKAKLARDAGADAVINYITEDFEQLIVSRYGGVNVVYDSVGETTFKKSLNCLLPLGMMVSFGQSSGPVQPFALLDLPQRSLYLTRPRLMDYIAEKEALQSRSAELFDWYAQKKLHLRIGHTFPLHDAPEAHRQLEGRKTTGKILLRV